VDWHTGTSIIYEDGSKGGDRGNKAVDSEMPNGTVVRAKASPAD